ncbi:uncharacterized protein C10orf62 homolog [Tachyglossus aculeatus]|uniref:uncharacterized protein C10orf62 homolog n=1 Tax=Tachyglossus aculeatus TaxID=9261 RepID=UPI0018F6681A|nr:uncharacterized protein C10orf62 homolog [Tachyglossus aculeatus]
MALLLGAGGLYLWYRRRKKRRQKGGKAAQAGNASSPPEKKPDPWIKSHFSRISDERLFKGFPESGEAGALRPGERDRGGPPKGMNTTVHVTSYTSRRGESATLHRESYVTHPSGSRGAEVGNPAAEEAWAVVTACTRELDAKGQHLAEVMMQRATSYQYSGHVEATDMKKEELDALDGVELKLKGNFLEQRGGAVAGNKRVVHRGPGHHSSV